MVILGQNSNVQYFYFSFSMEKKLNSEET